MHRINNTILSIIVLSLFTGCNNHPKDKSSLDAKLKTNTEKKYPELKLKEDFFDFGSIQQGDVVSHTFHFYNAGNDILVVKDLIPDCGCTLPKINKKEFNPNEEGSVEVIFDSKGWLGSQYKSVTIRTNSPIREKSVTIKANVLQPKE
jgi:hypothetical protein